MLAVADPGVIVGVDRFSRDGLPAVADRPTVGDFVTPSLEAILRLRPTLVVLDRVQTKVAAGLESAGIDTLVLRMETYSDVATGLREVGAALGRPDQAAAAIATLEAEVAAVRKFADESRGDRPRPTVLLVVDRELGGLANLVATGPDNYLDELIELAGGDNVLRDSPVRFPRISAEEIIRQAPDVIIDAVHTEELERATSDWNVLSTVPAVQSRRVYVLGDTMHSHPSPRLGETLRSIAERIYDER